MVTKCIFNTNCGYELMSQNNSDLNCISKSWVCDREIWEIFKRADTEWGDGAHESTPGAPEDKTRADRVQKTAQQPLRMKHVFHFCKLYKVNHTSFKTWTYFTMAGQLNYIDMIFINNIHLYLCKCEWKIYGLSLA